jgi:hypothetical protein
MHRFEFTFTPRHGSWLNLVEGFFSKLARSVLRHIRVTSKQEVKDLIMAAMDHFNQDPVVQRGLTNSIKPPDMIRPLETMNWAASTRWTLVEQAVPSCAACPTG